MRGDGGGSSGDTGGDGSGGSSAAAPAAAASSSGSRERAPITGRLVHALRPMHIGPAAHEVRMRAEARRAGLDEATIEAEAEARRRSDEEDEQERMQQSLDIAGVFLGHLQATEGYDITADESMREWVDQSLSPRSAMAAALSAMMDGVAEALLSPELDDDGDEDEDDDDDDYDEWADDSDEPPADDGRAAAQPERAGGEPAAADVPAQRAPAPAAPREEPARESGARDAEVAAAPPPAPT